MSILEGIARAHMLKLHRFAMNYLSRLRKKRFSFFILLYFWDWKFLLNRLAFFSRLNKTSTFIGWWAIVVGQQRELFMRRRAYLDFLNWSNLIDRLILNSGNAILPRHTSRRFLDPGDFCSHSLQKGGTNRKRKDYVENIWKRIYRGMHRLEEIIRVCAKVTPQVHIVQDVNAIKEWVAVSKSIRAPAESLFLKTKEEKKKKKEREKEKKKELWKLGTQRGAKRLVSRACVMCVFSVCWVLSWYRDIAHQSGKTRESFIECLSHSH